MTPPMHLINPKWIQGRCYTRKIGASYLENRWPWFGFTTEFLFFRKLCRVRYVLKLVEIQTT